jgi:transcriptional regulator with GAF, ATPase, and Fis domain
VDFVDKPSELPEFTRNDELERSHLVRALEETHWNLPAAAMMLDVSVDSLQQRMDRPGLYAPAK